MSHRKAGCPHIDRLGQECKALKIPFGAMVWFLPTVRGGGKVRPGGFGAVAIKGLFLAYHVHSGGTWSGDYEVAELESFLDNPGCTPREAKKHRTSRVEFHPSSMVFPIREAIDICERRAERCRNLCDVINARGEKPTPIPDPAKATLGAGPGEGEVKPDGASSVAQASSSGSKDPPQDAPRQQELLIPECPRDKRGEGELIQGTKVRGYKGSNRVPGWLPEEWKHMLSEEERRDAQAQYLETAFAPRQVPSPI